MIQLTSFFIDILKPEAEVFPSYDLFLERYSLITVNTVISQISLQPETYIDFSKEDMDKQINEMIAQLPKGAENKRKFYPILCLAAQMDSGTSVQEKENRVFASELFIRSAEAHSISNREMILQWMNASSFLDYFFLLEDTLKSLYIKLKTPKSKFIQGSKIIKVCLREVIASLGITEPFEMELKNRSEFFFDLNSLELMWELLNFMRNIVAHTNGHYDEIAAKDFAEKSDAFKSYLSKYSQDCISNLHIYDIFDNCEEQIKNTGHLLFNNSLENIIRNTSVFVMESLYVCVKNSLQTNNKNN